MESYFPFQKREPCYLCEATGLIDIEDKGDAYYCQGFTTCPLCNGKGELVYEV